MHYESYIAANPRQRRPWILLARSRATATRNHRNGRRPCSIVSEVLTEVDGEGFLRAGSSLAVPRASELPAFFVLC